MAYNPEQYQRLREDIVRAIGNREEQAGMLERILSGLEELKRTILENPITGIANGHQLAEDLEQRKNDKSKQSLYVVMIDIDHFGQFNKKYGEQTGNEVLIAVAQSVKSSLRDDDAVRRLSNNGSGYHLHGEEMLALYACGNKTDASMVAERIQKSVEENSKRLTNHKVTISLGVTKWEDQQEAYSVAQHRADRYMQQAKRNGRNQIYCGDK